MLVASSALPATLDGPPSPRMAQTRTARRGCCRSCCRRRYRTSAHDAQANAAAHSDANADADAHFSAGPLPCLNFPCTSIPLRDVETGSTLMVDTSDPAFQQRFAAAVEDAERRRRAMIARSGARYVVMEPGLDWLLDLARSLGTARPARRAA